MQLLQSELFSHRAGETDYDPTDPFADDEEAARHWPALGQLGLSREQIEYRRSGLGGSDANIVMSGNRDAIVNLWREKRGDEASPDLSMLLPVMLGQWSEEFNRQWFERIDGRKVSAAGIELVCPEYRWRRCTLDGMVGEAGAVWEAKHTNAFAKPEEVLERYMPQLQHNMAVAQSECAVLSVIFGNHKFEIFEVASDWIYQLELLDAELDFWDCVQTGREPVPFLAPPRRDRSEFARFALKATTPGPPQLQIGSTIVKRPSAMPPPSTRSRSWSNPMLPGLSGTGSRPKEARPERSPSGSLHNDQ